MIIQRLHQIRGYRTSRRRAIQLELILSLHLVLRSLHNFFASSLLVVRGHPRHSLCLPALGTGPRVKADFAEHN